LSIPSNNHSAKVMKPIWQLTFVLLGSIFFGELIITLSFEHYQVSSPLLKPILNPLLLAIFCIPVIYFSIFRKLVRDFSDLELTHDKLRITSAAFKTNEAIMICNARMQIISVNPAFEKITGYSLEEIVGKTPKFLQSDRHDRAFYQAIFEQLITTGHWNGEIWDRRKDGAVYPNESTITLIKNEAGEITECVSIFNDISERKETEQRIHSLAFYDVLTGLPNRRMLLDRLEMALPLSTRNQDFGALIFLDLDNFKYLNDMHGHDMGDMLLIEVAKRIKFCLRQSDTVARLGGDEFMVLLQGLDTNEHEASLKAASVAEKIRVVLSNPFQLKAHTHMGSVSVGITLFNGQTVLPESLIKRADMAMYESKDSGKNKVKFFNPATQEMLESRIQMEDELRNGILKNHLSLHYQAQINQHNKYVGAEALIRWMHPERGLISPYQFIPLAEESMLIVEIGNWVIHKACEQLAIWAHHGHTRALTLSINISAKQFIQPDFVDCVKAAISQHKINPARLKLELTESIGLDDLDFVAAKMMMLKNELGVSLSLDDFGTGYSSLSYLKRLPFDQLKIDRSFVKDIVADESDANMVKTIINMANNFGLEVIAEGVETAEQLEFLKSNGCNTYQGYLFSKPVPVEAFEHLVKEAHSHTHKLLRLKTAS
jgi:diguanylate cyclase (GGDEF)-like protein/PAS domain S-box-containing protein